MKYKILDIHPEDSLNTFRDMLIGSTAVPTDDFRESYVEDGYSAGYFEVIPNVIDEDTFYFIAVKLEEIKE